ncbi:MAG TPA: branched-chain amino acid ABC transporter permease [Solirubrobacteraceae bacterium]|nr:branched-chain amino acid ABC transporter permease [Solirubrobacteraceae bacterium]
MTRVRSVLQRSTLARSLAWVVVAAVILVIASNLLSAYNNLQLATGLYYFAALGGLTVLAGQSGQISLGHGALMAVGAYTVALLIGNEGWALVPAIAGGVVVSVLVGIPVGVAASRLRGPYLAGATLAFAVGLPALADRFPSLLGGENGLTVNPPVPPSWLGADFPLEQWEALIAGVGALVVLFVLYNVIGSGVGRSLRAVRDDEVAASLCGLSVGRTQTTAFILSAGCAGLAGAILAVVLQLAQPGAFPLQLSLALLTGVVLGGLGSLVGAMWGAALLTLLPNWTTNLADSFSLSQKVSANLPLAIYGVVLIVAMILWPSGIQGGLRALTERVRARRRPAAAGRASGASTPGSA